MTAKFEGDITKFVRKARENLDLVIAGSIEEMLKEVRDLTPTRSGKLRNSWTAAINQQPRSSGRFAQQVGSLTVPRFAPGDTIYFGNGTPYARRIEYGFVGEDSLGRRYNQRGFFMLTKVLSRARLIFNRVAGRVARR